MFSSLSSKTMTEKPLSMTELSELLSYEEFECEDETMETAQRERRMRKMMHTYIPAKLFRATVRLSRSNSNSGNLHHQNSHGSFSSLDGLDIDDEGDNTICIIPNGAHTPASIPWTPFSRARVMSRYADRVDTVMFAARDSLRLETQVHSRDELSREAAREAQAMKKFAIFDCLQSSEEMVLSCGNHCVNRVARKCSSAQAEGVASSRSMVTIRPDTFVYFEFSITSSTAQLPLLALGLSAAANPGAQLDELVRLCPCPQFL